LEGRDRWVGPLRLMQWVCTSAQTASHGRVRRWSHALATPHRGSGLLMLVITGLLVVLIAVVAIPRLRLPFTTDANLGWMSDRWLAEQRATKLH
jgi:hypothetical protein